MAKVHPFPALIFLKSLSGEISNERRLSSPSKALVVRLSQDLMQVAPLVEWPNVRYLLYRARGLQDRENHREEESVHNQPALVRALSAELYLKVRQAPAVLLLSCRAIIHLSLCLPSALAGVVSCGRSAHNNSLVLHKWTEET